MKHYFFFSYSRDDDIKEIFDFFNDLSKDVARRLARKSSDVGFIDQKGLKSGDYWTPKLEDAINHATVFIAMVSKSYCDKDFCKREWALFSNRLKRFKEISGLDIPPPLIVPVIWHIPDPDEGVDAFPEDIRRLQLTIGNQSDLHNKEGLLYTVQLKEGEQRNNYLQYVRYLGLIVSRLVKGYEISFAEIQSEYTLSSVGPSFGGGTDYMAAPVNRIKVSSLNRVHFVYGAATPDEISNVCKKSTQEYGVSGGAEWAPFFPESLPIGLLAQNVSGVLKMYAQELPLSDELIDKIRELEGSKELVVIVLDRWSILLAKYKKIFSDFDQGRYINCSLVCPVNEADPDYYSSSKSIEKALDEALRRTKASGYSLYFQEKLANESELRAAIENTLVRLKADMINRYEPDMDALDASLGKPEIRGPGVLR